MDYKTVVILSIIIILIILIIIYKDTIEFNWIIILTNLRGIIVPRRFWWTISDLFNGTTGVNLFRRLKAKYPTIAPMNALGTPMNVVTDIDIVKLILNNSPKIFGVGKLKTQFFKPFMALNVGVSNMPRWEKRREYNEYVLASFRTHTYLRYFDTHIKKALNKHVPTNFKEFSEFANKLTMQIVFGRDEVYPPLFDEFTGKNVKEAHEYIRQEFNHPQPNSLMFLAKTQNIDLTLEEILHQVPHWIFPINGLFSVHGPRLLLLRHQFGGKNVRDSILELFRLNNAVNTTFRTLMKDYEIDGKMYPKDTQFLIVNNPILRDPDVFTDPDEYDPDRWDDELFASYYSIMFNKGPQECPGRELSINLLESFIDHYPKIISSKPKLDKKNIPQMINPFAIQLHH